MPEIMGLRPKENTMTEQNASGAQAPRILLLGLSIHHKEDGCWMRFKASNGREALIDLNAYAKDRSPIVRSAIEQWIEDVRPNAAGQTPAAHKEAK